MTALAYAQATARARRDIVTAKEIRLVSAANTAMRNYCLRMNLAALRDAINASLFHFGAD